MRKVIMSKVKFILPILILFFLSFASSVRAQATVTEVGLSISVDDENVQNGDLICSTAEGYKKCTLEYDSSIYGVVTTTPSAAFEIVELENSQTVISRGETLVRVSSANGNIKAGDELTSSTIAGVATLATKNGYVIGTAQEDYSSDDTNAVGTIRVGLNIRPRTNSTNPRENLIDLLRSGLTGLGVNPISALRYLLASAMVLTSFAIGFIYFGRIAKSGVEAIGRNPLAGVRIQASVIINIAILLGVITAGLVVAYFILAI